MSDELDLHDLHLCFEGAVPAVIATASVDGVPNITYLSRVRMVDGERVALSNQFFSKTARNLAENPRASVLVIDPCTFDQYRLRLVYERTERRGPTFERLHDDVENVAVAVRHAGRLLSARRRHLPRREHRTNGARTPVPKGSMRRGPAGPDPAAGARLADLSARLSRSGDLDTLVEVTVDGLAELLGYEHTMLLLVDEQRQRLYTIASHGYDDEGLGSEVAVGEGTVGLAATALHAAAHRQPLPGAEVRDGGRPRLCRPGDRPGPRHSRCPCSPTSRAASPCRPWRWATWLGCWSRKAPSRLRSTRAMKRPSASWPR